MDSESGRNPDSALNRRREKPQLSCNQCRRRKSRCDRKRPCSLCSARSQACTYPDGTAVASPGPSRAPRAQTNMHDRLVHLERLVMSVMPDSAAPSADRGIPQLASTPDTMSGDAPIDSQSECGSMRISASELRYVGGDHWAAILDGIADLKENVEREEQLRLTESPAQNEDNRGDSSLPVRDGAFLLYGRYRPESRHAILAALPPRYAVDRYISRYFNYLDLVSSATVHGPVFLREYEAFWADPSSTPIMWIGLLFSMICLACMVSNQSDGPESETQTIQIELYREKIVQCLIMGEYTKSGPYVLETIINYNYAEFCVCPDANRDTWFLLAIEVNLAMRMGYHRDPSHFPKISAFQGEMRRRVWATVLMGDILISSQMGMPRMISDWKCDTAEPRNLNDADFDTDTKELPPSRPETELTAALGIIGRRRILKALGIIADLTNGSKVCSYEDVMQVDRILRDAVDSIPAPLKWKPVAASVTDSPQLIVARLFIRHMLYKGQTMLHQRFLSDQDDRFSYSRQTCIDASIGTIDLQNVLDEETCAGGQLHEMRWRVTSSMNHQFLTAAMILCSLLHNGRSMEREDEIRSALQRARAVWARRRSTSKEAERAADTISIVLSRKGFGPRGDLGQDRDVDNTLAIPDSTTILDNRLFDDPSMILPRTLQACIPSVLQDQIMDYDGDKSTSPNEWTFMDWDGHGEIYTG